VKLTLRKIDRTNWRAAIEIKLHESQETFVSPPTKSLAAAYVRQHGDNYDYTPMGIYDGDLMVGYVSTLCDPRTKDEYWIDDIMIDLRHQRKGLGRPAVAETIAYILRTYPRCETIKLSCHRNNVVAAALYKKMGFELIGDVNAMTGEPNYALSGDPLRKYR
jgi:diamine N-acetyltransferase